MVTTSDSDEVFTLREASEYSHVSRAAILQAIKKKKLKAMFINKRWSINRSDIDDYRCHKYSRRWLSHNGKRMFDPEAGRYSLPDSVKILQSLLGRPFSQQQIYYLVRTGQLKACRIGYSWVIKREDLEEFCESQAESVTSKASG